MPAPERLSRPADGAAKPAATVAQAPRPARLYPLDPFAIAAGRPSPEQRARLAAIFARDADLASAEARLGALLAAAPHGLGGRLLAYRFYFYRRQPRQAAHWALACLEWAAGHLAIPRDWRGVDACLPVLAARPAYRRLWVEALAAYAYHCAQLGERREAAAAARKLADVDPSGRLAANRLRPIAGGWQLAAGLTDEFAPAGWD